MIYCEECAETAGDWMQVGERLVCSSCATRLYEQARDAVLEAMPAGEVPA